MLSDKLSRIYIGIYRIVMLIIRWIGKFAIHKHSFNMKYLFFFDFIHGGKYRIIDNKR